MKLTQESVNQEYLTTEGVRCKCIAQTSLAQYVIEINGNVVLLDHNGKDIIGATEYDLVSEYTPARTLEEVAKDMAVKLREYVDHLDNCSGAKAPNTLALLKEYENIKGKGNE